MKDNNTKRNDHKTTHCQDAEVPRHAKGILSKNEHISKG